MTGVKSVFFNTGAHPLKLIAGELLFGLFETEQGITVKAAELKKLKIAVPVVLK
jgi:hypothetical protein